MLLVIRLGKRTKLWRQCVETMERGGKVDPYGHAHVHPVGQVSEAGSSI